MVYMIDQQTCPKGVEALSGGFLSARLRLLDPWGNPFRLYCSNTGSVSDEVNVCSDGPNQIHGDADDLCDPARLHEASLMMGSTTRMSVRPPPRSWTPRWQPELAKAREKFPWKPVS